MPSFYTTKEVSEKTGVSVNTLRFWVREKVLNPVCVGNGTGKRMQWSDADIDEINDTKKGQRVFEYIKSAKRQKDFLPDDAIVASGKKGIKTIEQDTTAKEIIRRAGNICVIVS